ncbi:MAG: PKD domain-containing protein [Bacteroidia bacterium]|nr:PKD domain-containing protein [Bacteroidia bacterium]
MSYNEEMDKIVLDKLAGYSEEPEPDFFRSILAERERAAKSKLLNRILLIAVSIAALIALLYLLLRNDKPEGQSSLLYPQPGLTASSADQSSEKSGFNHVGSGQNHNNDNAVQLSSSSVSPAEATINHLPATHKTTGAGKPTAITQAKKNTGNDVIRKETEPKETKVQSVNAIFDYFMDSTGKCTFYNQSMANEDAEYEWFFGDGSISKEKEPTHAYALNGYYHVCLTVTTPQGTYDSYCDDISIDHLPNRRNLIGKVSAGNSVPDKGWVYLISYDSVSMVPYLIDSSRLDQSGYFTFNQIPAGYYLVRATLETKSIHYKQYMPTYYGQSLIWNFAKRYNLSSFGKGNSDLLIINLLSTRKSDSGDNTIDGQTNTRDNELNDDIVILYDNNGKPIGFAQLGPDGKFSFNDLPPGSYQVFNPRTGSYTTYTTGGTSSSTPPPGGTTGGTTTQTGTPPPPPQPEIILYPNPCTSSDVLTVKFNNPDLVPYSVTVIDQNGVTKMTQKGNKYLVPVQEVQLDVSMLPARNYQVIVTLGNKTLPSASFTK